MLVGSGVEGEMMEGLAYLGALLLPVAAFVLGRSMGFREGMGCYGKKLVEAIAKRDPVRLEGGSTLWILTAKRWIPEAGKNKEERI